MRLLTWPIWFVRRLAKITVCAWSHRAFRSEVGRSEVGIADWKEVRCSRCDEHWIEER